MTSWHVGSNAIAYFSIPTKTMLNKVHINSERMCPESSSAVTELSVICHLHFLYKFANQSIFNLLTKDKLLPLFRNDKKIPPFFLAESVYLDCESLNTKSILPAKTEKKKSAYFLIG